MQSFEFTAPEYMYVIRDKATNVYKHYGLLILKAAATAIILYFIFFCSFGSSSYHKININSSKDTNQREPIRQYTPPMKGETSQPRQTINSKITRHTIEKRDTRNKHTLLTFGIRPNTISPNSSLTSDAESIFDAEFNSYVKYAFGCDGITPVTGHPVNNNSLKVALTIRIIRFGSAHR